MPKQLTIRYDEDLAREIEDLARREGLSRNQAVLPRGFLRSLADLVPADLVPGSWWPASAY